MQGRKIDPHFILLILVSLVPRLSINAGEENRAWWYQTYVHALDIAAFIPSATIRLMTNDVFAEDDLLGRCDLIPYFPLPQ